LRSPRGPPDLAVGLVDGHVGDVVGGARDDVGGDEAAAAEGRVELAGREQAAVFFGAALPTAERYA
jgi:hypothetical protein